MAETLAVNGGPREVPEGMVKSWPPITEADKQAVLAVLDSGHLHGSGAPQAKAFQQEWAEYCGVKYALVTNSGTSALHMAVAAAGLEPGDEVIMPAYTYWATAAAVLHHNCIPVFVDIEPESYCIDPALIEEKITDHTKALMPVHVHGMPADMDAVNDIAKRHKLVVLEDAAQAHGAEYKGRKVGGLGDAAGFSLNRSKNLTACDGGIYTTNDESAYQYASMMREFGEVVDPDKRREYNAYALGWMYRPIEFANAFGRSQLRRLDEYNAQRREMGGYLDQALGAIPGLKPAASLANRKQVYWTYVLEFWPEEIGLDGSAGVFREAAEAALRAEGVSIFQWQLMPVPAQDVFRDMKGYGRGCPWTCPFGRRVEYRGEDYPRTVEFIARHTCVSGVYPPNDMTLMKHYVRAFEKVMGSPHEVLKAAEQRAAH